ncbi:serine proteinase stubble-like isoform X2 [Planococcus citri]|uniref:serine proteinase stubble-like isoform X2 n=1 Tax=Planococcus citri TaxID=170843 RepID=UPI0031F9D7B9
MRVGSRGRRRRRHRTLHDIYEQRCTDNNKMEKPICSTRIDDDDEDDIMNTTTTTTTTTTSSRNNSNLKRYWTVIASSALFAFMIPVTCGAMLPAWETQPSSAGMGRNIRHLPCVSRRTGETGLCMFAYSCAKANGTHLGTCIDRFYFGSCCKIASGTDIDTIEPIVHNNLPNREDTLVSTIKSTYQRPSSTYSDLSLVSSSPGPSTTASMPVSMSTMSRPLSVVSIPSSSTVGDLYSSTYHHKPSSTRPLVTANKGSFDSSSTATSRTPTFNVTFSQTYSSPTTHVTTSPLVYSTTVTTTFQTGTHKPLPVGSTTAYSKPITKPSSSSSSSSSSQKPSSTKPTKPTSQNTGKPGSPNKTKPKPPVKPVVTGTPTYPAIYTPPSSTISSLINKTTLHSAFTNNGLSSKPASLVTEPSVPIKPYPSSTPGIPTPINQFTSSSKKPTKPPPYRPSPSTAPPPSSNYVKIPVSTVSSSNKPPSTVSSLSSHIQTIHTIYTTPTYPTTVAVSADTTAYLKFNSSTVSENEITERPQSPSSYWTTATTPSEKPPSRPWSSSSSSTATTSQPPFVTWTTIEEVPAVILPDRMKPSSTLKPSTSNKYTTKPSTSYPTYPKPSSSTGKPTKPTKPSDYRPTITSSSSSSTGTTTATSPSWVEVSVTTHAPSSPAASSSSEFSSISTTNIITTQTSSKPSTSVTIPVVSPLPIETTPSSSIETNEIESSALNMSDYKEVCGRRLFPTARIVGGEKASFGKWPWQISLRQWRTSTYLHKCGAALFNENWAVTAAHCVENVPPSDLLLRLGEFDLQTEEEPYGFQERRVQIVASHPQFDPRTFEYDLALLRFYEPVQFQPNIVPICVPEDDTNFVGSSAFVTGWGRLYEDGPLPTILQEVSVPVINNSVCESMYQSAGYIEHIPNIFICAGWKKGGFDSCEGDSGGPMVIQRPDKRWLLAGIISWGIGCAEPNQPGVYTRISAFRDWINQILQF